MGNASLHPAFNAVSPGHDDGGGPTNDPSKYRSISSAPQGNRPWFGAKTRWNGSVGRWSFLQERVAKFEATSHNPQANAVAAAAATGELGVTDALLNQNGIDVAHANENGGTALLFACADGDAAIARRLLLVGSPPSPVPVPAFYNSVVDESASVTPLIVACTNGHTECVEALVDAGVCVSSVSENDLPFKAGQPRRWPRSISLRCTDGRPRSKFS